MAYGSDEVVAEPRVDLDVVGAAHGVDRTVPARDRAERRLLLAEPRLQAPVDPFPVRALRVGQHETPADVGDGRVGEAADEPPERVGRPGRVRVREGDDLALGLAHRPVLGGDLPAAGAAEQADRGARGGDGLDEPVGAVLGGVGGDHDLDPLGGIVECEQVLEPPLDHRLLVPGGDDHAHARQHVLPADAPPAHARSRGRRQRIAGVRPAERAERRPEERSSEHRRPRAPAAPRGTARRRSSGRLSASA